MRYKPMKSGKNHSCVLLDIDHRSIEYVIRKIAVMYIKRYSHIYAVNLGPGPRGNVYLDKTIFVPLFLHM